MSEPLSSIKGDAESLKERIWEWMLTHRPGQNTKNRTKDAMNLLLDCIDHLEDLADSE